jgi:hypothetical protein
VKTETGCEMFVTPPLNPRGAKPVRMAKAYYVVFIKKLLVVR